MSYEFDGNYIVYVRHPVGFVHFKERDQRFEYIEKVLRDFEREREKRRYE